MAIGHKTLCDGPGPEHDVVHVQALGHAGAFGDIGQGFINCNHFHIVQVLRQLHGSLARLSAAHHNPQRGGEVVGVQAKFLRHHGFQAGLRPIGQLAPGRPCLGHIGFLQAEFLGFFVKILLDGLFFRPVVVAGCHHGLHGQGPVHQVPLAKLYCKVLVEKCAIHGTDHQRANQGLLRFAHGKLRHDAFIDGGRQAFLIVFRGQREAGSVGVFRDGQAEGLQFVPQAGRLSDLCHDGAAQ